MGKLSIFRDFLRFLKVRKKWWLIPVVVFLIIFGLILILAEIPAISPFIYALF